MMKKLSLILIISCLVSTTGLAGENMHDEQRKTPSAEAMIVDGLLYRPLSLAGTLVGTGLFLVTLPFSLIGGNADEAGQRLVVEPANSTFDRCLGCLPDYTRVNE